MSVIFRLLLLTRSPLLHPALCLRQLTCVVYTGLWPFHLASGKPQQLGRKRNRDVDSSLARNHLRLAASFDQSPWQCMSDSLPHMTPAHSGTTPFSLLILTLGNCRVHCNSSHLFKNTWFEWTNLSVPSVFCWDPKGYIFITEIKILNPNNTNLTLFDAATWHAIGRVGKWKNRAHWND